mmetsp:Transcript_31239/g.70174  ORF Transcript_31239/g.70174 Transcript_31239/m.70174 type:complete len:206 (+) Transcript_31239:355-972(+)
MPSAVVLKRWRKPWQLFVDSDGSGHAFAGSFGDAAARPSSATLIQSVAEFLTRRMEERRVPKRRVENSPESPPGLPPTESGRKVRDPSSGGVAIAGVPDEKKVAASAAEDAAETAAFSPEEIDQAAAVAFLNHVFSLSSESPPPGTEPPPGAPGAASSKTTREEPPPNRGEAPLASSESAVFLNRLFSKDVSPEMTGAADESEFI